MSLMFPVKIPNASPEDAPGHQSHPKEVDLIIRMCIFCLWEELCHKEAILLLFNFADSPIP